MHHTIICRDKRLITRAASIVESLPVDVVHEVVIREHKSTRSLEQNAKMWPMLTDISKQVNWYGEKLTPEEWKDMLTAGLKKQKAVPGIDGGFVVLGASTSKMKVKEMADLIELAGHFGDQQGVNWSVSEDYQGGI